LFAVASATGTVLEAQTKGADMSQAEQNSLSHYEAAGMAASGNKSLKQLLMSDAIKRQLAVALPKHMSADRMARVALTALLRVPKLAQCTQASFMECLLTCSQLGLEPDGRLAHLIPYKDVCTLIIDYKGLVALARRSGNVATIHADVVCENDEFDYNAGELKCHRVDFRRDRGAMYAVYAKVRMKDGTEQCEVMSRAEVESVRNRSRAGKNGPWVTDFNEMAKKTAFRRLSKWLELSPEYRDALSVDDDPKLSGDVSEATVVSSAEVSQAERITMAATGVTQSAKADTTPEPAEADTAENSDTASETSEPEVGAGNAAYAKALQMITEAKNQNVLASAEQAVGEMVEVGQLDGDEAAALMAEIDARRA
jgi:recombination protein RecT